MAINAPENMSGWTYFSTTEPTGCIKEKDTWFNPTTGYVKVYLNNLWRYYIGPNGYVSGGIYGMFAGGSNSSSLVEQIVFPFNSGVATQLNNLAVGCNISGACNSSQFGYILGGYITDFISTIQRYSFNGIASLTSNLPQNICNNAAVNSSIHGFCFGGNYPTGSTSASFISRMTFSSDSVNAINRGNLQLASHTSASFNESSHGYAIESYQSTIYSSSMERITFPFDSGSTLLLNNVRPNTSHLAGGTNSSQYGFVMGGTNGTIYSSNVDRIIFPWNSGAVTTVGNCSSSGYRTACCNSNTVGISNIHNGITQTSNIERITFPFDSGIASTVGNLNYSRNRAMGFDNTDFVSMFV